MTPQPASYHRHRFPAAIISDPFWLHHVFSLAAMSAAAHPVSGACVRETAAMRKGWASKRIFAKRARLSRSLRQPRVTPLSDVLQQASPVRSHARKQLLSVAFAARACLTDEGRKPCIIKYGAVTSAITNAVEHSVATFDHGENGDHRSPGDSSPVHEESLSSARCERE
jgi:hypothetical protein